MQGKQNYFGEKYENGEKAEWLNSMKKSYNDLKKGQGRKYTSIHSEQLSKR